MADCPPVAELAESVPIAVFSCLTCALVAGAGAGVCPPVASLMPSNPVAALHCEPCEEVVPEVAPPIPPQTLINWLSCPQAVTYIGDDLMFITTDDGVPVDTASFSIWNGSYWEQVYTMPITNTDPVHDPGGDYWQWEEPPIDVYTRGSKTAAVMARLHYYALTDDFQYSFDVFVFNDNVFFSHTYITEASIPAADGPFVEWIDGDHRLHIDSTGRIHLVLDYLSYDDYYYTVFDFISDDNGVTFVPVAIAADQLNDSPPYFLTESSSGALYFCQNTTANCIWKSLDHGTTWSSFAGGTFKYRLADFRIMNDVFFAIDYNEVTDDVTIKRSADGSAWSTVYTATGKQPYFGTGVLGYDGTYYYALCNYRTSSNPLVYGPGYTEVYRSSNGTSWSLLTTITDDSTRPALAASASFLAVGTGKLAYTYYYSEVIVGGDRLMAVWESTDQGATWTILPTLFSDQTGGSLP